MDLDYKQINQALWNEKTKFHMESDFYELDAFKKGKCSLKEIELELLGDVKGKSILHLQCHFGQDSLSLARKGAKVTGVDLSNESIAQAKKLNIELGLDAQFVQSDVYDSPQHITEKFDIVFTSYGTIGWLPDIKKWAETVNHFLKPGGKFVFVEMHPVVWMHDADFSKIEYSYFNTAPIIEVSKGTYAEPDADIEMEEIGWNHHLSEVIGNLLKTGLTLNSFEEYPFSPYNCFKNMKEIAENRFVIEKHGDKLPLTYSLIMTKSA